VEPLSDASAVVARVDFGGCTLLADDDRTIEAIVRAKLMGPKKSLGNTVVVGDRVAITREPAHVVIESVEPRRNAFSRRAAGDRPEEQVVGANLDQVVMVAAMADPPFRAGLVDRVLAQAEHAGIPARLVLNKTDLGDADEARAILDAYRAAGVAGHSVCAKRGEGVDPLREACRGRRSLFVGHSGVGKSTLLSALAPGLDLTAGTVNPKTGKGRHTTTAAVLLRPEAGLELIDTPGIRSFALWGIGARDLEQAYLEFRPFLGSCRFGDCRHDAEPGCGLRAASESGQVSRRRFESFHKLREELEQEQALAARREGRGRL
jgi:ribosome biogenesis GTPase